MAWGTKWELVECPVLTFMLIRRTLALQPALHLYIPASLHLCTALLHYISALHLYTPTPLHCNSVSLLLCPLPQHYIPARHLRHVDAGAAGHHPDLVLLDVVTAGVCDGVADIDAGVGVESEGEGEMIGVMIGEG